MRAISIPEIAAAPELTDLPTPTPGPDEILVELAAASLNPIDTDLADGRLSLPTTLPLTLGVDGAGRVVEAGGSVVGFAPGDLVHGQFLNAPLVHGTYADSIVTPTAPSHGALAHTPAGLPADVAAALPTAGMTALGVIESLDLGPGRTILIVGATGGVGVFAVQLAAATGAEVIATARADADEWIRKLGATDTVDYATDAARATDPDADPDAGAGSADSTDSTDSTDSADSADSADTISTPDPITDHVRRTHPQGVHALLDLTRDPARFATRTTLVRDGGSAISTTFTASPELLASDRITVTNFMMQDKPGLLARITDQVAAGRITVPIDRTITLEQVPEALVRAATTGGARGKTVVRIAAAHQDS